VVGEAPWFENFQPGPLAYKRRSGERLAYLTPGRAAGFDRGFPRITVRNSRSVDPATSHNGNNSVCGKKA
jgi:hypothetical protein